jgi:NAD(P)H-hydrate epimerase
MFEADRNADCISEFYHSDRYDALAIGCGLGTRTATVEMMQQFLNHLKEPCVFDADALNIIAAHPGLLGLVPEGSVLTPHPKEFVRLFGESQNSFYRLMKAREIAIQHKIVLVMKGAFTKIVAPDGRIYFNSTGNPGMATAGSGDVLTGIIGALMAQGYKSVDAARLGVYLHGLSADIALEGESHESLMAGDIIGGLGKAFRSLQN